MSASAAEVGLSGSGRKAQIVKEGWLFKRGEHIKTWRPRYFVLFDDGALSGFKVKPDDYYSEPLNNFTVKECRIVTMDRPKPYTFMIRGLQLTSIIERMFHVESQDERQKWVSSILSVSERLSDDGDIERNCRNPDMIVELLENCSLQGTSASRSSKKRKITLESFEFLKVLGKGTFGKVLLSREKATQKLYAIKILKKEVIIERNEVVHTQTEDKVLRTTNHPFLISLKYSFQTNARLCFVMEYVNGGELFFHLRKEKVFSEEKTRFYGAEIVSALAYLHSQGILYRDVKLENILLDQDGHIKMADFGLCKEDMTYGKTTKTFCGTPEYLAPEVLEDDEYGRAIDWWATGVVMYEMMCGRLPFYNKDYEDLFILVLISRVRFPSDLSTDAKDLISGLLAKDPTKSKRREDSSRGPGTSRTAPAAVSSALPLGGGPDDAKEIMAHPFFSSINWKDLELRKVTPPFKPEVTSDTDTKYFDEEFTRQSVELSPPDSSPLSFVQKESQVLFTQFNYEDYSSSFGSSAHDSTSRASASNMQ